MALFAVSTAGAGGERAVSHLANASGNTINTVGRLWQLLPGCSRTQLASGNVHLPLSLPDTVLLCAAFVLALPSGLIKIKSEIKANKIHGNVARLVQ